MEENAYQLFQHELEVHEVMKIHHEERGFPSIYPCSEFMNAAGILQDFQSLVSNVGLEHFIDDEPPQYAKLTMSMVYVDGFRVARTRGTTRRTQGFERRGLNV
jgi:hypothetical protein